MMKNFGPLRLPLLKNSRDELFLFFKGGLKDSSPLMKQAMVEVSKVKQQCVLGIGFILIIILFASTAGAGIVNPSFETGDLSGWEIPSVIVVTVFQEFSTASGNASAGTWYLTATSPETYVPPTPLWPEPIWGAAITQTFSVPSWATMFSIDVRNEGCQDWSVLLTHTTGGPTNVIIDVMIEVSEGVASSAANGFTRYTVDVSEAAGLDDVLLNISASSDPELSATFSVDNVTIVPEPTTLALLLFGLSLTSLRKRR